MALGMKLDDAILRSTVNPAKAIHKFPEIGTLGEGKIADVAVLAQREGVFAFKDAWDKKMLATKKIESVMTIRAGRIEYDVDGRTAAEWSAAK